LAKSGSRRITVPRVPSRKSQTRKRHFRAEALPSSMRRWRTRKRIFEAWGSWSSQRCS